MQRSPRSYVVRRGRTTSAQKRALSETNRFNISTDEMASLIHQSADAVLEIGFGDGSTLLQLAADHPDCDFFGVEVYPSGLGRCLLGIKQLELENLYVCLTDVQLLLPLLKEQCLKRVLIFNPDPWPHKRHHKRRLLNRDFLDHIQNLMKAEAILQATTDWDDYAHQISFLLDATCNLAACDIQAKDDRWWLETKFQRKAREQLRSIHRFSYQKSV